MTKYTLSDIVSNCWIPCYLKLHVYPWKSWLHGGRFPFTKRFRKFRLGCKWNMIFRFVPLENFRKKWNFWKGSPVFPVEIFRWKSVFHLRVSQRFTSSRPLTTIVFHTFGKYGGKYGGYFVGFPLSFLRMFSVSWAGSWLRNIATSQLCHVCQ